MKDSLHSLLELQEIDREIDVLERSKSEYPEEIEKLTGDLEAGRARIQETASRVAELERNRRATEGELEITTHSLKKHQDRLYEVKSNREYDAIQAEIESLAARKESQETGILQSIEDHEDLSRKLEEDREAFRGWESELQVRIEELSSKLDSVEGDIEGWTKKRKALESHIDKPMVSAYMRIRRVVKGGVAVVAIRKGACGGCYRQLSPQLLVEARRTNKILRCENCGRLIVWKEEEVAV